MLPIVAVVTNEGTNWLNYKAACLVSYEINMYCSLNLNKKKTLCFLVFHLPVSPSEQFPQIINFTEHFNNANEVADKLSLRLERALDISIM